MKKRYFLASVLLFALCAQLLLPAARAATAVRRTFTTIAAGTAHTIAMKEDGTVWGWGSNQEYQLGNENQSAEVAQPMKIEGLSSAVAVAAGYHFSAAVLYDGSVWAWGGAKVSAPTKVSGLSNIVAVACGQTQLIALKMDGTVWTWSLGGTASKVNGLSEIAGIAAGSQHFLARSNAGEVWGWGGNWAGQLGTGDKRDRSAPAKLTGIMNVVALAAGNSHSLAVDFDGKVYAWGDNTNCQLGVQDDGESLTPIPVAALKNVVQVAAGYGTSAALTADGAVYMWGYGEYGQLGDGSDAISRADPKAVAGTGFGKAVQVTSGLYHNALVAASGQAYVWGRNRNNQLGTGKSSNEKSPRQVLADVAAPGEYPTNHLSKTSSWAIDELEVLYEKNLVPPIVWRDFTGGMTRAEFAHMLVKVYETVRKTEAPYEKTTTFTDLEGHPLRIDMLKANKLGIISGAGDNRAAPDATITRQEVAKMLCSFLSKIQNMTISDKPQSLVYYADAEQVAEWAAPYVAYAHDNDIMKGTDRGFSPNMLVSHEQGLLIVARVVEKYGWTG